MATRLFTVSSACERIHMAVEQSSHSETGNEGLSFRWLWFSFSLRQLIVYPGKKLLFLPDF